MRPSRTNSPTFIVDSDSDVHEPMRLLPLVIVASLGIITKLKNSNVLYYYTKLNLDVCEAIGIKVQKTILLHLNWTTGLSIKRS